MSVKTKIYLALGLWLGACIGMFTYGVNIFNATNADTINKITEQKKEMFVLQDEQKSYQLAQQDLKDLAEKKYKPEDLFSKDVNLVREIQELEKLQEKLGLEISLGGISGTVSNASAKDKKTPGLMVVPYSISANGEFSKLVGLIETLENLSFATQITSLSISSGNENEANMSMGANFYLKRN